MTPEQIKDKLLYVEKSLEILKNDSAACIIFIKMAEEEFLKIGNLSEGLNKNDALLKTYREIFKKDSDSKQSSINNLQSAIADINKNLDVIRVKFSDHAEKDDVLNALIEYSKKQIAENSSQLLILERKHQDLKDELAKTRAELISLSGQSNSNYKECKELIDTSRRAIDNSNEALSKISSSNDEHIVKITSSFAEIGNTVTSNKNYVASQLRNLEEKIQKIADSSAKDSQSSIDLSATMDAIAEMRKTMEVSKLDVQNSTIRSSNISTQVQILEKKIENIYLLLKKLELSQ